MTSHAMIWHSLTISHNRDAHNTAGAHGEITRCAERVRHWQGILYEGAFG
jgi:hypothetical protein